jgi:hypothetical protein
VFTVTGTAAPGGGWLLQPAGTSLRYGAITALGLLRAPEPDQRRVLAGQTSDYLVGKLAKRLDEITGLGDAALVCWAAAEAGHGELEAARYGDHMRRRLVVKPGITGLWQVNGRSDLPWDEAVRLDLRYVENWSFALDLQILWKTGAAVFWGSGAY